MEYPEISNEAMGILLPFCQHICVNQDFQDMLA